MSLLALALSVGLLAGPAPALGQAPAPPAPAAPAAPKPARMGLTIPTPAWAGDLAGMIKRRQIRVLVPYSKTFFFVDKGVQRGIAHDLMVTFGDDLNKKLKTKHLRVEVVFVPTKRDRLLPALTEGRGDIVVANLTITEERQELVDFTDPLTTNVSEIVVTGPASPPIATLDDLAGQEIFVRQSRS